MGFVEGARDTTPPPRGWSPPKKIAHNIGQIVYNGDFKTTITKGRCCEQAILYHKKAFRCAPNARNAQKSCEGLEQVCQQFDHNLAQAVRKAAQLGVRHLAARTDARRGPARPSTAARRAEQAGGWLLPLAGFLVQSFHGSNSPSPARATANGRSVCRTRTVPACWASTSGRRR